MSFVIERVREIDEVVRDVFDVASREQAKEKAGSRRKAYRKGIEEVKDVAGKREAEALAEWIESEIRSRERFPSAREVRKEGADICRQSGYEVSTGSWLGA